MAWDAPSLVLATGAVAGQTLYAALFLGDPSAGGVEVNGAPYARQLIEATEANPAVDVVVFDLPAGAHFDYVGVMSAATAGTVKNSAAIPEETFGAADGTHTVTISIPAT